LRAFVAERFTLEQMVQSTLELYLTVTSSMKRGA